MRLYATANKAKICFYKDYVNSSGIQFFTLDDLSLNLNIDESSQFSDENAKTKALAYYQALKLPLFTCDSGLFFENVPIKFQPGVNVRRVNGTSLDDESMIEYYSLLAKRFGGNLTAQYKNAICLVLSENEIYEYMGEDISSEKFIITYKPHIKKIAGFPLESLSVDIVTGEYYLDQAGFKCSSTSSSND